MVSCISQGEWERDYSLGCLDSAKSGKVLRKVLKFYGCSNFVNISIETTTNVRFDMLQ